MNFIKEIWTLLNNIFAGNPFMLFLSLGFLYLLITLPKAIIYGIKYWRGEIKKEQERKEEQYKKVSDAQKTINNISKTLEIIDERVEKQNKHHEEMNGTLKKHISNYEIHVPKNKLVTNELFGNETKHINDSLKVIFEKLDKV